ncbi:MTTP [Cordylochernes scorpioides]|uniref:MTTP n=1 Tax=Cordylochernes scorpioides TaxID=51811 RepID=A0ABY6L948_9ARAC|nr:MTTP [Cordylochernes scorpioides]
MGMVQKQGNWVPYELKPGNIERRICTCELLLKRQNRKGFLHRIVTGDEKWIHYDNPKRIKSWVKPGHASTSTAKPNIHGKKLMLCIWRDQLGVIYYELLQPNETITGEHIAPSDYHMFRSMTQGLAEQHFTSYEEAKIGPMFGSPQKTRNFFDTESLASAQLQVAPPKSERLEKHASSLDRGGLGKPVVVYISEGLVREIRHSKSESTELLNLKKGLISIFQISHNPEQKSEMRCSTVQASTVTEYTLSKNDLVQSAKSMEQVVLDSHYTKDSLLYANSTKRAVLFIQKNFDHCSKFKKALKDFPTTKPAYGSMISLEVILKGGSEDELLMASSASEAMEKAVSNQWKCHDSSFDKLKTLTLVHVVQAMIIMIAGAIKNYKSLLKDSHLATVKASSTFLRLLPYIRVSTKEELSAILANKMNANILTQLVDVMGATGSPEALSAVMENFDFTSSRVPLDLLERFLLSVATSQSPPADTLHILLKLAKKKMVNEKLHSTVLMTLGSVAHTYCASQDCSVQVGLSATGLSGLAGGEDDGDPASGVMQLSVLGESLRPYLLFSGSGELMSLVWSGAGSEPTTALKGNYLLSDYSGTIALSSGQVLQLDLKSAMSLHLSGQVEISIWNRNAHAIVKASGAISVLGSVQVDSSIVQHIQDFNLGGEGLINFITDLDFYSSPFQMCVQMDRPAIDLRLSTKKLVKIPGTKYTRKLTGKKGISLQGNSYPLNNKNAEMCRALLASSD